MGGAKLKKKINQGAKGRILTVDEKKTITQTSDTKTV
jgi:hypothetical protein